MSLKKKINEQQTEKELIQMQNKTAIVFTRNQSTNSFDELNVHEQTLNNRKEEQTSSILLKQTEVEANDSMSESILVNQIKESQLLESRNKLQIILKENSAKSMSDLNPTANQGIAFRIKLRDTTQKAIAFKRFCFI
jgi:hypothetical protein